MATNEQTTKTGIFGREPVLYLALVQTALALVLGFGIELTPEQIGAIMAFSAAVLGFAARSQVTPVETLHAAGQRVGEAARDDVDATLRRS